MRLLLACLFLACLLQTKACFSQQLSGNPTIVYLIRHAEKDTQHPTDKNPPLSPEGHARAKHLAEKFKDEKITAVYSSDFIRTRSTVQPLADSKKLKVQLYAGADFKEVAKMVEADKGKTILICGHSNTLIPIIKELGGQAPVEQIDENAYDNLFKVVINQDGTVRTSAEKYP